MSARIPSLPTGGCRRHISAFINRARESPHSNIASAGHRFGAIATFWIIAASLCAFSANSANADSTGRFFEAVGSVNSFYLDGEKTNQFVTKFRAVVSNCVVTIRSEYVQHLPGTETEFVEYVTYGSNSTLRVRHLDLPDEKTSKASPSKATSGDPVRNGWNRDTILARPDHLPPYGFEFVTIVWLALGSRCAFLGLNEALVEPVVEIEPGVRGSGLKTRAYFQTQNGGPGFLAFMAELCGSESTASPGQYGSPNLKSPFKDGYTNAIFRTVEWTNIAGLEMPLKFELFKFEPDYSLRLLRPPYWLEAHIDSYVIGSTTAPFPPDGVISAPTIVIDYAVANPVLKNPYTSYSLTNGHLLPAEKLRDLGARRNDRSAAVPGIKPRPHFLMISGTIAVASLLVLISFFRSGRTLKVNDDGRKR